MRRLIRWWTALRLVGVVLLALAFLIGALGYLNERGLLYLTETAGQIIADFYAQASTELMGVAIIILAIETLYQRRETEPGCRVVERFRATRRSRVVCSGRCDAGRSVCSGRTVFRRMDDRLACAGSRDTASAGTRDDAHLSRRQSAGCTKRNTCRPDRHVAVRSRLP